MEATDTSNINDQLSFFGIRIEVLPVSELKLYSNNPNKHNAESISSILDSIKTFGFLDVVLVDTDHEVIYGHGRIEAALEAGLTTLPVLVALDLSKPQTRALRIADNVTRQKSDFNPDLLLNEIEMLGNHGFEIQHTGLDELDLEAMRKRRDESSDPTQKTTSSSPVSTSDATTYTIIFPSADDANQWYAFLKILSKKYPESQTGERIKQYLQSREPSEA